jgi:hypothetical protein
MKAPALAAMLTACTTLFPASASAQPSAPAASGLQVQTVDSGFVIAPDAKFTNVNDDFATFAGVYGGWLTDRTLLVGAGAYWLANRDRDFTMQYFGGLARWTVGGHRRLGLSAGALVGVGDATISRPYGDLFGQPAGGTPPASRNARFGDRSHSGSAITSATRVLVSDDFFIAEPQVNAIWNITGWMRLDAGVGYRLIGTSDLLEDQLRGVSGSIGLQFGGR